MTDARRTAYERFMEKVWPNPVSGCWHWLAADNGRGYGIFLAYGRGDRRRRRTMYAHRWAFEFWHRSLAPGEEVMHSCDNPGCVNPDHLAAGSRQENAQDAAEKGRCKHQRLEVEQVRMVRESTDPARHLALELGVTVGTIHHIRRRLTWRFLEAAG